MIKNSIKRKSYSHSDLLLYFSNFGRPFCPFFKNYHRPPFTCEILILFLFFFYQSQRQPSPTSSSFSICFSLILSILLKFQKQTPCVYIYTLYATTHSLEQRRLHITAHIFLFLPIFFFFSFFLPSLMRVQMSGV